ncbi:unnamed protein product, partial [Ectocarpus sp. 8 AP-2014]
LKYGKAKVFWRMYVLLAPVCRKRSFCYLRACDGSSCAMVSTRMCAS